MFLISEADTTYLRPLCHIQSGSHELTLFVHNNIHFLGDVNFDNSSAILIATVVTNNLV